MKYTVKFAKGKMNKAFGELMALNIQELCKKDTTLVNADRSAVQKLESLGLATVSTRGLGWKPEVFVDLNKMQNMGFITSWDVK